MALRSPVNLSAAFLLLALVYAASFNVAVRTDKSAATSRFDALMAMKAPARAAGHGERALKLAAKDGDGAEALAPLKARVAEAMITSKDHGKGSDYLYDALLTDWGASLSEGDRLHYEDTLARARILAGDIADAAAIYDSFLQLAGDEASVEGAGEDDPLSVRYAEKVAAVGDLFAAALNHAGRGDLKFGAETQALAAASQMANLGAFYTNRGNHDYAAAGLLRAAYDVRKQYLRGDHQDTVQITLMLGPVLARLGRLRDAELLYLEAFHAQEKIKGSNSPELSLYMRLLAGIYEQQGRLTEAQLLNDHIRRVFRDAFGEQRYAINRQRDRRADVNRPVSQFFVLAEDYAPKDLVAVAKYSVPTGKAPSIDEMKLRLAPDPDADPREANLPARLAQLISLCRSESGERITLRSGYRSYTTQSVLYRNNGDRGTVTPPGMSEHQTGLAADINVNGRFMRESDRSFQCFEENGFRFGFILSYPRGNNYLPGDDSYEPWHWRYVGVQTAQLYREAGPQDKPQEFLAELPCYQDLAASGSFIPAGEPDICQQKPAQVARVENAADHSDNETAEPARILNKSERPAQVRR